MAQPDTSRSYLARVSSFALVLALACQPEQARAPIDSLVINELMSDNDAAFIDEAGEVSDYIELANLGAQPVQLRDYALRGDGGRPFEFPDRLLAPGELIVVFADDDEEQGPLHAPWKLSAAGETVELLERANQRVLQRVELPALQLHEVYARYPTGSGDFARCRYASPARDNGASCTPPAPTELPEDTVWAPYTWPTDWPATPSTLVLNEIALQPARFVEVRNAGTRPIALDDFTLRVSPTAPGVAWPNASEGELIPWPGARTLAPGERVAVEVSPEATAALEADPAFEGVLTLFAADGSAVDRVDFMRWPEGAILARWPESSARFRYCANASRGEDNASDCDPLARRDVGDRLRHLHTPGDFAALAQGESNLGQAGVKFIVDTAMGDAVHLLSARVWALHYTFVRERIQGQAPLDRCDPEQASVFLAGWIAFSDQEYLRVEGRRYLLGTLVHHAGSGLRTVDFTVGDQIIAPQIKYGFHRVLSHADTEPADAWSLHPTEPRQVAELRELEGQAPIVGTNAPFRNLKFQPLTEGIAMGTLRYVPADELESAALGRDVIVVTDAVPNDLPFVSGLITEAFQTPLAHVNVLSQNRGTPNMALRNARSDPRLAELLDQLVRLEVSGADFSLRSATASEVDAFLQTRKPAGPRVAPRLDTSLRGLVDLSSRGLADLPAIGAKAAQLAELRRVRTACGEAIALPEPSFAIPVAHYLEHFERSGARALLENAMGKPEFRVDAVARAAVLAEVRTAIEQAPVEPSLARELEAAIAMHFGRTRVRFRSSSNTEDLPGFNGAGLYLSLPVELGDPERTIEGSLRAVWASLWNMRAYDEREYGNIDQAQIAMGVLVHPSFVSERANVIAISRDVRDPTRADIHYFNAQSGEASVANPAPGVTTEQFIHHWRAVPNTPVMEYQAKSSLTGGANVLTFPEAFRISCQLAAVHDHFQSILDPGGENRWFAMDVEVKLVGPERRVVFKQARPYSFGRRERPTDCREF